MTIIKGTRSFLERRGSRLLLGALFLLLMCYTGTLAGAFSARPHFVALVVTVALCCSGCLWPSSREPGAPHCIAAMWERCQTLPAAVLLFLAAWLVCSAIAARESALPFLSAEVLGSQLWVVLIAALIFGYAARTLSSVLNIVAAMIVALDAAIVLGAFQYFSYWSNPARDISFRAQHHTVFSFLNHPNDFGHYIAFLLPLALWDALRAARARAGMANGEATVSTEVLTDSHIDLARPMRALWTLWRRVRPGVLFALGIATSSRSNWLSATLGILLLFALWQYLPGRSGERRFRFIPSLVLPLAVGAILTLGIGLQQSAWMRERLRSTVAPTDFGNAGRGVIWRNSFKMAKARPLWGWGPGTFAVEYPQHFSPDQYHELVLQAHNIYLHRLVEEGAPALIFWLAFVLFIWIKGWRFALRGKKNAPEATSEKSNGAKINEGVGARRELAAVFVAMLFAYGVCGFFVMTEQMPTMTVHFWGVLALLAALIWSSEDIAVAPGFPVTRRISPASRWLVRGLATGGLALFAWRVPALWNHLRAHEAFDLAMENPSLVERIALLREARDGNPQHPLYWAQLGQAQWQLKGVPAARSIADLYRAAVHRSPHDGAFWHNIGVLCLISGDSKGAIRNETRAVRYYPTCSFYHAILADAYAQSGNTRKERAHRALARKFNQRPVVHEPLDPNPQNAENIYFSRTLNARYRHDVRNYETRNGKLDFRLPMGELIKPPGYTMAQALGTEDSETAIREKKPQSAPQNAGSS